MSNSKPPVGLAPRWVKNCDRIREILEAMDRYVVNLLPIPEEQELFQWIGLKWVEPRDREVQA